MMLGGLSHIEHILEEPSLARFYEQARHFSRVILMDRRGVGLSDPVTGTLTLEDECAGHGRRARPRPAPERAVLFAYGWGGPPVVHFAVTRPQRVRALVLYAAVASGIAALEDFGIERVADQIEDDIAQTLSSWGTGDAIEQSSRPRASDDVRLRAWFGRLARLSQSPGAMRTLWRSTAYYDVREEIATIRVPTLILHRTGDRSVDVRHSRDMAERIPGARFVELEGIDNLPSVGDADALIAEIEEFLTGVRRRSVDRALLTVLITDIVGSTGHAARLGDGGWSDLLAAHDSAVRHQVDRYDGREVKTIGDSFLVVFSGAPSLAHRCALAIVPGGARARPRGARRDPHRGVRADRRGRRRHGGAHRLADRQAGGRRARCSPRGRRSARSSARDWSSTPTGRTSCAACPAAGPSCGCCAERHASAEWRSTPVGGDNHLPGSRAAAVSYRLRFRPNVGAPGRRCPPGPGSARKVSPARRRGSPRLRSGRRGPGRGARRVAADPPRRVT